MLGLHTGHLIDLDINTMEPRLLQELFARPICSLRARYRDGLLAVTDFEGLLQLYQLPHTAQAANQQERPLTKGFLASTRPATRLAKWDDLKLTDGLREWDEEALNADELPEDAPGWAQIGATLRKILAQEGLPQEAPAQPTDPAPPGDNYDEH